MNEPHNSICIVIKIPEAPPGGCRESRREEENVVRTHSVCDGRCPQEGPCSGRVSHVCRFREWGRENTQDTPIEVARPHENSEKERLRGPRFGPFGAFDFRTRIKGGGRKRPPPGHKAPQCGAFPVFEEGAPFRHSRRFQVVGGFGKASVPSRFRPFWPTLWTENAKFAP